MGLGNKIYEAIRENKRRDAVLGEEIVDSGGRCIRGDMRLQEKMREAIIKEGTMMRVIAPSRKHSRRATGVEQ